MAKKIKDIILKKNRTWVLISAVDSWIFDLKYLVNGKEKYHAQILKPDIPGRIRRLKQEGFKEKYLAQPPLKTLTE